MTVVNVGIAFGARMLLGGGDDDLYIGDALFLLALLMLLITLYDRNRTMRYATMADLAAPAPAGAPS